MDDRKLDEILKAAKDQSERFFARWDYELTPQMIQQKYREGKKPWKRRLNISNIKLGAAFACVVLLLLAAAFQLTGQVPSPPPDLAPTTGRPAPFYLVHEKGNLDYDHPLINLLMAKDFIPKGSLGIQGGVLVEKSPQGLVTKIIPYQLNPRGELVLPADRVLLQIGEELLLVGIDLPHQVEVEEEGFYLQRISEADLGSISQIRFSVLYPGEDWLRIMPNANSGKSRSIYIKITD